MKYTLAAVILAAVLAIAPGAKASGVLVDVKGTVTVKTPDGQAAPVKVGMELVDGSTVTAAAGGSASVLMDSGAMDEVSAGATYKVGQAPSGKRTDLGGGVALAMRELTQQGEGPTIQGMVREAKGPSSKVQKFAPKMGIGGIYPRETAIRLGGSVAFKWDASPPVNWPAPAIVIEDSNKNQLAVIPIDANSTEKSIGAADAKLAKGAKYSWFLATKDPAVKGKTMRFNFSTLSAGAEGEIDSEISKMRGLGLGADGTELLVAQVYFKNGLMSDMVNALVPLWNKSKAPFVRKLLYLGYSRMGQAAKANQFSGS